MAGEADESIPSVLPGRPDLPGKRDDAPSGQLGKRYDSLSGGISLRPPAGMTPIREVGKSDIIVFVTDPGPVKPAARGADPVVPAPGPAANVATDGPVKLVVRRESFPAPQPLVAGPDEKGAIRPGLLENTVQALTNAMVRTLIWMQDASPQQILATVPEEYLLGNKAMYLFAYNNVKTAYSKDGYFTDAGAKTTLKALASFNPNIKPGEINLAQTYTNEFVKKAHAKHSKKN